MAGATAEKPKKAADKTAEKDKAGNGRGAIDEAHKALGTKPDEVPGAGIDTGPQDVHAGDPDETGDVAQSASGAPTQLSFAMAGKKPTTAGLRLTGGKLDIDEQFSKGQKIVLRIEAEVGEIAFVDQHDPATGQVIGCERRHKARIVGVSVDD